MIGDDAPQVTAVVSCTCGAGGHCHLHTMERKERTADSVLENCENRVSVSYAALLRNYPGSALVILASGRVLGVSIETDPLVASNQWVLYTSFYVLLGGDGTVTVHALLALSLLWTVLFLARRGSSVRISNKKRKY